MRIGTVAALVLAWALSLPSTAPAREGTFTMSFDGKDHWDSALYDRNIDVDTQPGSARLIKTELISDEMGNITDATVETVSWNVRAKKELMIENPAADKATLIIYTNGSPGSDFILEVNGVNNPVNFDPNRMLTGGWSRIDVDPKQLKKGLNTFVLYPAQVNSLTLYIDNCRLPNRSAKSTDGGASWDYDHLGPQGFCDGEYLIRLRLSHYPSSGEILSDYLNAGDFVTPKPVKPRFEIKDIQAKAEGEFSKETTVALFLRGGSTPSFDANTWDSWKPVETWKGMKAARQEWKYFQWKAVLSSANGLKTPSLAKVTVTATVDAKDSAGKEDSADVSKNRRIVRGYYNYSYQPFEDGRLRHLREWFRLDEVVGGCSSEFEKFETLATWVRGRWRDGWGAVRTDGLKTPWDAWVALNLNDDYKASGMCTIYANTFVQCCLAVGLNARGNVLDHHFVSEIWSDDYERWILFDIGFNNASLRTVHMELDSAKLSSVEILKAVNAGKTGSITLKTPPLWKLSWPGDKAVEASLTNPVNWKARVGIPVRNNYLQTWLPGELQHGFGQYSYDGYLWWKKTVIPEYEEYTFQTSHYRDMYWTINQVQMFFSETDAPGTLKVQFDTVTPNLDKILVRIDGGDWKPAAPEMSWPLKSGANRIESKPVNKWGLDGITSEAVVSW
jgi:hypothetical protein